GLPRRSIREVKQHRNDGARCRGQLGPDARLNQNARCALKSSPYWPAGRWLEVLSLRDGWDSKSFGHPERCARRGQPQDIPYEVDWTQRSRVTYEAFRLVGLQSNADRRRSITMLVAVG